MSRVKCQVPFSTGKREKAKKKTSKHLYVISSKRWNIQTDYPMGMPVMKGGSSQICVLVWTDWNKPQKSNSQQWTFIRDLKQEMEHSNGLSNGYTRNERRLIADQRNSNFSPPSFRQQKQFFKKVWKSDFQKTLLQVWRYNWSLFSWCCPNEYFLKKSSGSTGMHNLLKNI